MATQHIVYPPLPATVSNAITGLTGDVVATGPGVADAVVIEVGGKSAADIALSVTATESASSINDPNALVLRDGAGSFAAEVITAEGGFVGDLTGNADTADLALEALHATDADTADLAAEATHALDADTADFATTAGSAGSATTAVDFTGNLVGDVTGTQSATVVSTVGGQTASAVSAAAVLANAATAANTPSTIVRRDAFGGFNITAITGNLIGNATTATTANNFSGTLAGDVTGTQSSTTVATVGGQSAANISTGVQIANAATSLNTANAVVRRGPAGEFSAGVITASLTGNATTATTAGTAGNVTGTVAVANGGTGLTSLTTNGILYGAGTSPAGVTAAGAQYQVLQATTGGVPVYGAVNLGQAAAITGTLTVGNGGTGSTTSTGTGSVVLNSGPTLVAPVLGTPASGVATNLTGLPLTTGVTGTLSVANGGTGVTSSTGTGSVVLSNSPTLVTPALGTPSAAVLTNATGLPIAAGTTGTLPVNRGGTNSTAALSNNRVMQSSSGAIVEAAAITGSRALASDTNGIPVASATTAAELAFVNGVTSAIQTQLNAKQATGNYITALTGDVTASGPGSVAGTVAAVGGQSAANVAAGAVLANAATSANTASAIVKRGASGEISVGAVSAVGVSAGTGRLTQSPPAAPSINNYALTNGAGAVSTTDLNPGFLVFSGAWGIDLGYLAGTARYRTRIFCETGGDISFASPPSLPTAQSSFTERMVIRGDTGNVGIATSSPTSALSVNGSADKVGGGSWGTFSDASLKDVTGDFAYGLDSINGLRTVCYTFKKGNLLGQKTDKPYVGFIAQEVQKVIPEAVSTVQCASATDPEEPLRDILTLNQDHIILALVNAVKELSAKNDELMNRVAALEEYDNG